MNFSSLSSDSSQGSLADNKPLEVFFSPRSVAIVGATEKPGSAGLAILQNLLDSPFGGSLYPVNPRHETLLGLKCYPNLKATGTKIDLAIIVTPAPLVPGIIREGVEAGVKGAIIISAGFKEIGPEGVRLEKEILEEAQKGALRLIGPNCLGLMNPQGGLNATFAPAMASPGNVAFISQSGALCTAVLDWSLQEKVGFSGFVSIGSMLDVGWGDLIDYFGDDPKTKSIVIYMESIGNARAFLSAAREVALTKPIIIIKAGRTGAAAAAAASHTGTLAGSDEVLDAAFRRSGVLRVNSITELFYMAEVLAMQPRPRGKKLTIITNAGGPGVLATDALIGGGGELAELPPASLEALNNLLPGSWSRNNPVDILGDAEPERFAAAFETLAKDPESHGLLVILTPQAMTEPTRAAELLKQQARNNRQKPVLACWMGGTAMAAGMEILRGASIPAFRYPDTAAQVFNNMWRYDYNLKGLYETPILPGGYDEETNGRGTARQLIEAVRQTGRSVLTEVESKTILKSYGLPVVDTRVALAEAEAVRLAGEMGFPVVLKLYSKTITHKTEVGGVQLNLNSPEEVQRAFQQIKAATAELAGPEHFQGVSVQPMVRHKGYEIILGSTLDPQFGPVLLFGSGGQLVEVLKDRALALPPLNTTLARRMIEQTKIYQALKGVRGQAPVDLLELENLMVRFSQLVAEQPRIKEIDINPLLVSPREIVALDARIILHGPAVEDKDLPGLAIRPYPAQYIRAWTLKDGTGVVIRPIRPEDEPAMVGFHQTLSERSVYFRYFHMIGLRQRIDHERLTRICFVDYDRAIVLVADYLNPQTGEHEILGVGRLTRLPHPSGMGDFAMLISDNWQGRGLGTELLRELIEAGRAEKFNFISGDILAENSDMQRVCRKLGFQLHFSPGEEVVKAELKLA